MRRMISAFVLAASLSAIASAQTPEGFTSLFNGKDLTGWKATGNPKVWGADADKQILFVEGGGGGWLMTEKQYANFEIRLEYKMPKQGNSGVALRTPLPDAKSKGWDPAYIGMEIQLLDDANWKNLQVWQHTGSIYNVVPAKKVNTKAFGEWNTIRIVAKGPRILVENNGEELVDANLKDYEKEHAKRHPGILRDTGHLGLQSYNYRVEFKNIFVKSLD